MGRATAYCQMAIADSISNLLALAVLHEIGLEELTDVTVEHIVHATGLMLGAHILHQLVGLQHVVADLAAPLDLLLAGFDLAAFAATAFLLGFVQL